MRRSYHILHILLIAAMLVAAVAMAQGGHIESGFLFDVATNGTL